MSSTVVFVHGIGDHKAGYSAEWQTNFDRYLMLPSTKYKEVVWESVFDEGRTRLTDIALTSREKADAKRVQEELETLLLARESFLLTPHEAEGSTRSADAITSWEDMEAELEAGIQETATGTRLLEWIWHPKEYLGDFVRYLVSKKVRKAVRKPFKDAINEITDGEPIAVISHSWGTVVAYDSLLELAADGAGRDVRLITLGSPLWLVRWLLDDRSGKKPGEVSTWLNVHARGDLIGGWLSRGYRVDKEFQVPAVGDVGAHSSYFAAENEAVQRDLIAPVVLD